MPIEVLMPALSPTMEVGTIAKWLKNEGDKIKIGDVLAEIETDKATMELESIEEGVLGKILIASGTSNVKVNELIALILTDGEDESSLNNFGSKTIKTLKPQEKIENISSAKDIITSDIIKSGASKIFASPLAKRIASNNNIALDSIIGSGPSGRIIKNDVMEAIEVNKQGDKSDITLAMSKESIVPHTSVRKVIASRLLESKQTIPHFYLTIDCNIDKLLELRAQINEAKGIKISVNDFIIKATSIAMKKVPEVNASWSEEGIINYSDIDISVAVAAPMGLITPIIRNADKKSLEELSGEMKSLAAKAKDNKLKPIEYQGGGFTISNLGMFNIQSFSAIINPPQSAILAVGASGKKVIVDANDNMVVANIMNVTLSCDHRVVDGVVGAQWLNEFRKLIENPILMFV